MDDIFFNIVNYLGFIPILLGFFYWKSLVYSVKIIVTGYAIQQILSQFANILGSFRINNLFIFSILALINSIWFWYFFNNLSKENPLKNLINISFIFNLIFILFSIFQTGFKQFNTDIFVGTNLIGLILSIYFFIKLTKQKAFVNDKILFLILVYLILTTFYQMFVMFFGNYLFSYLNGTFFKIIWYNLNPFFNLIGIILLCLALIKSKQNIQPSFENLDAFNKD